MSIHVALRHTTHYTFDRRVTLSPHVVRLRPAPHSRTPILAYTLKINPYATDCRARAPDIKHTITLFYCCLEHGSPIDLRRCRSNRINCQEKTLSEQPQKYRAVDVPAGRIKRRGFMKRMGSRAGGAAGSAVMDGAQVKAACRETDPALTAFEAGRQMACLFPVVIP